MLAGIDQLGLFVLAGVLLNLTPGPDVVYIVGNGLRGGWRAGAVAALGITAGCFTHVAAATVGLSALVAASAAAFTVLKWVGAAYLLYLGLSMLLARRPSAARIGTQDGAGAGAPLPGLGRVFAQGFWTNALNPKVALFFLAFLPQFIVPHAPDTTLSFLVLGLLFIVNSIPINLGYGLGAAWVAGRFAALRRGGSWLERGGGALFVYFGIRLALAERPAA